MCVSACLHPVRGTTVFAIFVEDVEARSGLSKKHGRKIHVQYSKHDDATEL